MDGDSSDVVRQHLHLARMNADAKLDSQASHRVAHGDSGSDGAGGASERRQEAISRGVHLPASEAIELRAEEAIVFGEHLLPGGVPEPRRSQRRVDDVGHEERRYEALVLARHAERADVAEHVHHDHRLIPNDPDVMPGWDVEDVAGPDLGGLAVVHLDVEATLHQQLKVVDLARGRALDRLQGLRPAKARLEDAATDCQGADADQCDEPLGKSAHLIRRVQALLLDGSAGTPVALEHAPAVLQPAAPAASSGWPSEGSCGTSSSRPTGRNQLDDAATKSGLP